MERKIVADSSANMLDLEGVSFASAPLTIRVDDREFVDDEKLDCKELLAALAATKKPSHSSCPNVGDWLTAFGQADQVFVLTLTSAISGDYSAALNAAEHYLRLYPERKVHVLDSRTTGPELELLVHKLALLIQEDLSFEQIVSSIEAYAHRTHLMFALKSVENFARNGRVSPIAAKAAGILNIRIVGQASSEGELQMLNKCRGEKGAFSQMLDNMLAAGFAGGPVYLRHTCNASGAEAFARSIRERFDRCTVHIGENRGLCSYYAEPGGLLVGFESQPCA